ncbi:RtcB family protein [Fulvivirgaceae bacterium BMA12]|uniref:3'-phosphate/5'-hydroxy nucleic acid ligase n=1 Tax=Agaribacillus aureus TaxID=3051825 RepID=A0ABT8L5W4_9BACT|nr:RtcB family protein [Fulvivirgaceae bacterium BMA12]
MGNHKLRGKDLKNINYETDKAKSLAIDIMSMHYKHYTKQEKLKVLLDVKNNPEHYLSDPILGVLASEFTCRSLKSKKEVQLLKAPGEFKVFGRKHIADQTYQQMDLAMSLPIAERGALMPDAHMGYGLPIGGVLATRNAVVPYGVGLDIGCRMSLSLFDIAPGYLKRKNYQFKMALKERTCFGSGGVLSIQQDHEILDRKEFTTTPLLRQLHGKAVKQLGTSGSGNHFVEFGEVELVDGHDFGMPLGKYLGLLSHSGSRGLGAGIARHYTGIAREKCLLPNYAQHFAWLNLDTEEGMEYWMAMNLAGDYAKACHDQIHRHLCKYLGIKPVATVENHHNFAWKEKIETGETLVIHRKGATPAGKGVLGIIPGSMTATGYIVRGKGEQSSLSSASHGAGRKMSRAQAKNSYTKSALKKVLSKAGVSLIGGGIDEAPIAYKDLDEVMASQTDLVDVIGRFTPKIVRMDKA